MKVVQCCFFGNSDIYTTGDCEINLLLDSTSNISKHRPHRSGYERRRLTVRAAAERNSGTDGSGAEQWDSVRAAERNSGIDGGRATVSASAAMCGSTNHSSGLVPA